MNDYRLLYGGQQPNTAQQIGQMAQMAGSIPSPAAPFLQGAGILANLYGTFQAGDQAEQNYELKKAQWEKEVARQEQDRKRLEEAQRLSNIYSAANYTNEQGRQDQPLWQQYFRQVRA